MAPTDDVVCVHCSLYELEEHSAGKCLWTPTYFHAATCVICSYSITERWLRVTIAGEYWFAHGHCYITKQVLTTRHRVLVDALNHGYETGDFDKYAYVTRW